MPGATRKPALVQIHSSPGLGNAIGALYQAMRGHSPLVVIGGDAGLAYQGLEAQMAADLVSMARPVTKWSTMVVHPSSLLRTLRRAVKLAATPPMGPVYVCLPQDILDAEAIEAVVPALVPNMMSLPDEDFVAEAAKLLAGAKNPLIFVGDGIAWAEAQNELTTLAETLGANVWGVDSGDQNMAPGHPLWAGQTGHMFGFQSRPIVQSADVALVAGTYMLPEVFPELGTIFADGAKVIHVDLDSDNIGKNHPVDLASTAHPKPTLKALAERISGGLDAKGKSAANSKLDAAAKAKTEAHEAALARDRTLSSAPMDFSRFMQVLGPRIPANALVFDEALTSSPALKPLSAGAEGQFVLSGARRIARHGDGRRHRSRGFRPLPAGLRLLGRRRRHVHDPGALVGSPP